jgi:hypothetical protein
LFRRLALVVSLGSICAALVRGQSEHVFVVSTSGGQYSNVQSAIDAAQNGDSIVVEPGSYPGFTIDNRARLDIAVDGNAQINGSINVTNCLGYIVLSGFNVHGVNAAGQRNALTITNDSGPVRILDCTLTGANAAGCIGGAGAVVSGSHNVEFVDCTFFGTDSGQQLPGASGMYCLDSHVALYDCSLRGGRATCYDCGFSGWDGGDGLTASNTWIFASRCEFYGARGADGPLSTWGGNGGNGLELTGSSVSEAWIVDCIAQGGQGGLGDSFGSNCCGFTCISEGDGNPGSGMVVGGGASLHPISGFGRSLNVPSIARTQIPFVMQFAGQPNEWVYFSLSTATGFQWQPAFNGVSFASTIVPPQWYRAGTARANGILYVWFTFPDFQPGIVVAQTWHVQSLHRNPQGDVVLGPSRPILLLDSTP